jgi:hypothetical protein
VCANPHKPLPPLCVSKRKRAARYSTFIRF